VIGAVPLGSWETITFVAALRHNKMPRHHTVRAAKTRTTASGCAVAGGKSPALERSAVCQFPRPSPIQRYRAADAAIGANMSSRKTSKSFFNGENA
jgi:hypothetical protein